MASDNHARPILIAEDDAKTARLVSLYLENEGFRTLIAADGRAALAGAARHQPLLVVLDLMLPGLDGWEVCRELRRESNVPILILSAREEEFDRVLGLTLGADDYVVKPFSPRELVARVRAILRRYQPVPDSHAGRWEYGALCVDAERHEVTLHGEPVSLTPSEFTLLKALVSAPGRVLSRRELLDHLYPGRQAVIDRVVDVHIGKLRQKLESDPAEPRLILTVRGVGYRLAADEGARADA